MCQFPNVSPGNTQDRLPTRTEAWQVGVFQTSLPTVEQPGKPPAPEVKQAGTRLPCSGTWEPGARHT